MIVVWNRATQETFLKARFVIFRCQKYVKRVHRNNKKNLPWAFKKVSWVALFHTTGFVPYEHVNFGNVFTVKNCYNVLGKLLVESIFSTFVILLKK